MVAATEASAVLAIPLYEATKGLVEAAAEAAALATAVAATMGAAASVALEADTCSGDGSGRDGAVASVM